MSQTDRIAAIARHVWTEPRRVAEMAWDAKYSLGSQLMRQIPREEAEAFVDGEGWAEPDRVITIDVYERPDFAWWEPRHDAPWRRQQARVRELDRALAS